MLLNLSLTTQVTLCPDLTLRQSLDLNSRVMLRERYG